MRKKSHISLAGFLVKGLDNEILTRRWKSFYVGSLLPDCRPSFLTVRHEYGVTFSLVEEKLRKLVEDRENHRADSMRYMMDLGQIFHYIADYFTFPHNSHYPGNLKDHCIYEEQLKHELRSYIREGAAVFHDELVKGFETLDEVLDFIRASHQEYVRRLHDVEEDCEYITRVCSVVLAAIADLTAGFAQASRPAAVYAS